MTGPLWPILPAAAAMLMTAMTGCDRPAATPPPATVTIAGRTWTVELATTADARYEGLSNREQLPPGRGMLFIYPDANVREFCMRQCLIPLDIAFIGPDRRVVRMHTMEVEPYGFAEKVYSSGVPMQYALEVPAGELAAAGVRVGDEVTFSPGVAAPAKADPGP